jgi:hypothetical protein
MKKSKRTAKKRPDRSKTADAADAAYEAEAEKANIDLRALERMLDWSLDLGRRQQKLIRSALEIIGQARSG